MGPLSIDLDQSFTSRQLQVLLRQIALRVSVNRQAQRVPPFAKPEYAQWLSNNTRSALLVATVRSARNTQLWVNSVNLFISYRKCHIALKNWNWHPALGNIFTIVFKNFQLQG